VAGKEGRIVSSLPLPIKAPRRFIETLIRVLNWVSGTGHHSKQSMKGKNNLRTAFKGHQTRGVIFNLDSRSAVRKGTEQWHLTEEPYRFLGHFRSDSLENPSKQEGTDDHDQLRREGLNRTRRERTLGWAIAGLS